MSGLSTIGSISFGIALVAGRKRVPNPATGKTALRTGRRIKPSIVNRQQTFCHTVPPAGKPARRQITGFSPKIRILTSGPLPRPLNDGFAFEGTPRHGSLRSTVQRD